MPLRCRILPEAVRRYVLAVEAVGRVVGRAAMYLVFVMMGVLLYSSVMRTGFNRPPIWTVEIAQFLLAAYYLLGGAYSLQLDAHVRMDLLYGRWSPRGQAFANTITAVALITYLIVLLIGGISSSWYAIAFGQMNSSAWRPPLWPIKVIMTLGIALMILQAVAIFFRDLARARGREIA
jgi:TRAP-type mannitol/chloroaromatic compound transport system permease small subunit